MRPSKHRKLKELKPWRTKVNKVGYRDKTKKEVVLNRYEEAEVIAYYI